MLLYAYTPHNVDKEQILFKPTQFVFATVAGNKLKNATKGLERPDVCPQTESTTNHQFLSLQFNF